jgi:hypothetical protein
VAGKPIPKVAAPRPRPGFIERARRMLVQPQREWAVIDAEFTKVGTIFRTFVLPLSVIPPLAYLLGAVIFGQQGTLFGTFETTVGAAVQDAVIRYICGLAAVFLLGLALDLLAPVFSGRGNRVQGTKVAAYASTPAWLFGVLAIVPRLGRYSIAGTLWTLVLVYLGAPLLMKVPSERAAVFGLVAAVVAAAVFLLVEGLRLLT